jgi:hypothetical protein
MVKSKNKAFFDFITDFHINETEPDAYDTDDRTTNLMKSYEETGVFSVMDPANVAMISTSNKAFAAFIIHALDVERNEKAPQLDYAVSNGTVCSSKYSPEYLKMVLKFISVFPVSPRFFVKKDYPLMVEWKLEDKSYVRYILAPRVDQDD